MSGEVVSFSGGRRFESEADLLNLPEPSWLIPEIIPSGGLGFIVGQPGAGKSFLALEIAKAVSLGRPLLDDPDLTPTTSGWVLVVLPESAPSWSKRVRAWNAHHGQETASNRIAYHREPGNLADPAEWANLEERIANEIEAQDRPLALVIIDTLSSAVPGLDENSQAAVTPLMANAASLVNQGITVILTHHPAKNNPAMYRGSSVLLGSCDWMLRLTVSGTVRELEKIKLRDAEDIGHLAFSIENTGHGPVATRTAGRGPWGAFDDACTIHAGLRDTFLDHGLVTPDGEARPATGRENIYTEGLTLAVLRSTWGKVKPLPRHPREEYQAEYNRRATILIQLVQTMVAGGALMLLGGSLTGGQRAEKMKAIIKQVPSC